MYDVFCRSDFETEARVFFNTDDTNLARVLGVNMEEDPWLMVTEFSDHGDLNQFLQDHVAETTLSKSPGVSTLRWLTQYSKYSRINK